MKVLLVGSEAKEEGGYGVHTVSTISLLNELKSEGKIDVFDMYGYRRTDMRGYDVSISILNPMTLKGLFQRNRRLVEIYKNTGRNIFNVTYETSPLPSGLSEILSTDFITDIMVQSDFILEQIKGMTGKPVYKVPIFVDHNRIEQVSMERRMEENTFRVFVIGQHTVRKGIADSLIGFSRVFGNNTETEMILKYNVISRVEPDPTEYFRSIVSSNTTGNGVSNITTIAQSLKYEDIINLYRSSSVLLMPSRGEGMGIPAVEAMLVGTPVIYTNWSSLSEICNLKGNYPVDYILDEAHSMAHFGYENGLRYAVPLISSIIEQLNTAYFRWKRSREEYYISNRETMIERYGKESIKELLWGMINGQAS